MIRSWNEIRAYYADHPAVDRSLQGMLKIVSEINSSRYKDGLFAWTSANDLCIAQIPVSYPYNGPYLRISPIANGQLEFRYIDTPLEDKQWRRIVDGEDGFARLERFMEQLPWFLS
jgi:hypothetical protein